MTLRVEVARTFADVERLASLWDSIPWQREEAERAFFVARAHARSETLAPFAVFVLDGERPVGALAGRIDSRRLPAKLGYTSLYAPRVRLLHVIDGGVYLPDQVTIVAAQAAVRAALRDRQFDAVALPHLPIDSPVLDAFESLGGSWRRQRRSRPQSRRRLVLPDSFEQFVASRSPNTRWRIRRDARRLAATFGDELSLEIVREPSQIERLFTDADRIAATTYQRALGAGFADTPERRALTEVALANGWLRAYLLYIRGEPIAFWICSVYRGTLLLRLTGYDQAYAELRVGLFLLAKVIEDAIADPAVSIIDFGQGEAAYKQQFGDANEFECDLIVFAPTLRATRINLLRNVVLVFADGARRTLDATRLTDRVRSGWRDRLRRPRVQSRR
jgi:hypothetical protein